MAESKKPTPPASLAAFVEQTAKMLRTAASKTLSKKGKVTKEVETSTKGKVERLAKFLRSETDNLKKRISRKKKND